MAAAPIDAGATAGALSKSAADYRSTSPKMHPCGSLMKPSTRPCTSKVEVRYDASWRHASVLVVRFEFRAPGHDSEASNSSRPN